MARKGDKIRHSGTLLPAGCGASAPRFLSVRAFCRPIFSPRGLVEGMLTILKQRIHKIRSTHKTILALPSGIERWNADLKITFLAVG
jgi:hypothetical protein